MCKILIVDDQLEIRELAKLSLELVDCHVLEANHGEKALKLVQLERPELIFLSAIALGGAMTISEIIQRLKAKPIQLLSRLYC